MAVESSVSRAIHSWSLVYFLIISVYRQSLFCTCCVVLRCVALYCVRAGEGGDVRTMNGEGAGRIGRKWEGGARERGGEPLTRGVVENARCRRGKSGREMARAGSAVAARRRSSSEPIKDIGFDDARVRWGGAVCRYRFQSGV